jgi:GMP synthase-like glutamine amidotransferase
MTRSTRPRLPLLVVQHDADKPLGRIAAAFAALGVPLDVHPATEELPEPSAYGGLVVLPGLADPVDDDLPIQRARDVIEQALADDLPVLGLCLGGQLLVQALGGDVYRCEPELGFGEISATAAAAGDPLLASVPDRFDVFHAHAFAFRPPSEATVLLENRVCVQACRVGEAWAFQCHPEVTREWVAGVASGIRGGDGPVAAATAGFFRANGIDPDRLEDDAARADATLARVAESIAAGFAARCTA